MDPHTPGSEHITLMAAGELRAALNAFERGQTAIAVSGLMAIDPDSWRAIESRLSRLGGGMRELLALVTTGEPERAPRA